MPRAVAFDIGNVLIHWDPRLLYRKLLPSEDAVERFLREVCPPEWNERMDAGLPLAEGLAERIARFPHHEGLIRAYGARFGEMMLPMPGTIALLHELAARRVPIFALSNWAAETFERTHALFPWLSLFDGVVISGRVGLAKPDPRIFEHLLRAHGLAARETLFVDDRAANVAAARALGFEALHFESGASLRAALVAHGLL